MTRRLRFALLMRSFLVQGSWNYRNLIGTGFAWALLPAARRAEPDRSGALARPAVDETFNSHPYLAPVAMGALTRVSMDGADPDRIRRFKDALCSPLGSLGDQLVWSAWRPTCVLGGILLAALGAPPVIVVAAALVTYNSLHLALRAWGLAVGLRTGFEVAGALKAARLAERSERVEAAGVLVVGILLGLLAGTMLSSSESGTLWIWGGAAALVVGAWRGETFRRWAPLLLFALVAVGFLGTVR